MARINLEIDDNLKRRAELKAAHERKTLTQVVKELLTDWVNAADRASKRRRLTLQIHKLGTIGTLSRRELYEDLR